MCGAQPHPSHPNLLLPMTVLLRRVSGSKSHTTCLYKDPSHRVNKMKFQDDFGYPLLGYPKLVSAMPHSVLGYFILLPRARPSMARRLNHSNVTRHTDQSQAVISS